MMFDKHLLGFIFSLVVNFVSLTCSLEMNGMYQPSSAGFVGLSLDFQDVTKRRCAVRCLQETCRGIHFEAGTCKLLFDTNDVPQNERTKYSPVALDSELLINVFHKCSSVSPCQHGGKCEAVEWIYQCTCTGTAHHGTVCQKAGNLWAAPAGWSTLHPQLNLNLDDQRPYFMYNGASYVSTENGYGFRSDGGTQYVDLGDWSDETCFVNVDTCQEGFTLLAYVNIVTANYHHYLGYISSQVQSLAQGSVRYGPAIYGYRDNLGFEVFTSDVKKYTVETTGGAITFPTGWVKLMVIYKVNNGIQIYVDNILKAERQGSTNPSGNPTSASGHIVLGRHLVNTDQYEFRNGQLSVDWLAIWDRPLTEEERNLLHQT